MFKNLFKDYIYPSAVFSGGMIGVGFLSLPYVAMKAGFWPMIIYFLALTSLVLLINLIFCEISLKTPDFKRFPGFVGYYLGKWAKLFILIESSIGTIGVLLVYLLIGSQFLSSAIKPIVPLDIFTCAVIYFFVVSLIIYFDIKIVARVEFWILFLLFLSLIFIFIEGFSKIKLGNFSASDFSFSNLFLPYGPLLFALWGVGLIPETEEMLIRKKNKLKKIITISTLTTASFYFIFTFIILGITGKNTDPTALTGLGSFLGNGTVLISLLIGSLATLAAFITQGIVFKKTLIFDLGIKHQHAFVITCFTPMILFLLGIKSFIPIVSFIGGVFLGINGILILLMYKKIGGKKIIIYPLSFVFFLGIIYEIIYFIK